MRSSLLVAAVIGLARSVVGDLLQCGDARYDPTQYVCYNNNFLCPIISGEPLSYCSGACYSKFMYTCSHNVLVTLPTLPQGTPFTLTASNPNLAVDGKPITAGGQRLVIGGTTSSYCPTGVPCPPGDFTALLASGGTAAMDVMVPGGQQVFLDPYWSVHYTQAHSAYIPPGSVTTGFAAYQGGGFVNLNGNGWGWVACPPTAAGGGGGDGSWNLVAKNETNAALLGNCYGVNLKIKTLPQGTVAAWQYT